MSASSDSGESPAALAPMDMISCERLRCRLTAAACAARQSALRHGHGYADHVPAYPMCAAGRCAQGAEVRRRLPDEFVPAAFRENRSDLTEQRRARLAWESSRRDRIPSLDAPRVADPDGERQACAAPAGPPPRRATRRPVPR